MYKVALAGGIASGKSTVARELERLGARRIDLDQVSRDVLRPGSPCLARIAEEFGKDVVDAGTGELDRGLLARRAFATGEAAARLEALELPYITGELERILSTMKATDCGVPCVVVEIPLLDRMEGSLGMVDEVVCVTCPLEKRRCRAIARGMDSADFDARVRRQPSDAYLREKSDCEIANDGSQDDLIGSVRAWWKSREAAGWKRGGARG
ncbi:MAG: dephospho-CoA kinase [Olsenella sp.]|nr:dephospho-CoA kinase [Olsenella sp.]